MPKLHIFTLCEKVLIEANGVASLIGLFTIMEAHVPHEAGEIAKNAVIPKDWAVFSIWEWEDDDEGREYTQFFEVLFPDGEVFFRPPETKFKMERGKRHQITGNVQGVPVGQQGKYIIQTHLEHEGRIVVGPVSTYFDVRHIRAVKPS